MIALAIASIALASAMSVAALWLMSVAFRTGEARRLSDLAAAEMGADLRVALATAETADRLRRAETIRADTLEEELANDDHTHLDTPVPGARVRVLAGWHRASTEASGAATVGNDPGPVSVPAATDRAAGGARPD